MDESEKQTLEVHRKAEGYGQALRAILALTRADINRKGDLEKFYSPIIEIAKAALHPDYEGQTGPANSREEVTGRGGSGFIGLSPGYIGGCTAPGSPRPIHSSMP